MVTATAKSTAPWDPRPELQPYPGFCPACYFIPPSVPPAARVKILSALADLGAAHPWVETMAWGLLGTVRQYLGREPEPLELVQWLMNAIHDLVDYQPDPPGEEVFQEIPWTLFGEGGTGTSTLTGRRRGSADCEDLATAVIALGRVLGLTMNPVWWDQPGAPLNHVSAEVCDDGKLLSHLGGCIAVETTIPGAVVGEDPYAALKRLGPAHKAKVFGQN